MRPSIEKRPQAPVKETGMLADESPMFGPADAPCPPPPPRVTLDSQPVQLPETLRWSLPAIHAHLEALALTHQRILHVLVVDGVTLNLQRLSWPGHTFRHVAAATISFKELAFQLLRLAREQINQLRARAESAVLLAVINDWPPAQRLWWQLMPDLKEPLVTLSFLPELGQPLACPLVSPAQSCARLAEELGGIQKEIEVICTRREALELSNSLELRLLPWLARLEGMLQPPHESPAA